MRDYSEIISDMNYQICDYGIESISFYYTNSTFVDYIGIHCEGSDIHLWCSEELYFDTEDELVSHLQIELAKVVSRLENCRRILLRKGN